MANYPTILAFFETPAITWPEFLIVVVFAVYFAYSGE